MNKRPYSRNASADHRREMMDDMRQFNELPSVTIEEKERQRKEIAEQTEEFLRKGGEIQQLAPGESVFGKLRAKRKPGKKLGYSMVTWEDKERDPFMINPAHVPTLKRQNRGNSACSYQDRNDQQTEHSDSDT